MSHKVVDGSGQQGEVRLKGSTFHVERLEAADQVLFANAAVLLDLGQFSLKLLEVSYLLWRVHCILRSVCEFRIPQHHRPMQLTDSMEPLDQLAVCRFEHQTKKPLEMQALWLDIVSIVEH